ncbi:ABC transporter ATP-binding protein/permease [uncultured Methanospirillum sp.]|uniref:ABC transporter ATP-binding protein n=1 Tax=uncultured Methanospirillum sp. TaxID=262503 RepID=UPI0029C64775|nr:ABC transporter ATP-binding protein/permease [uncultured Methanospirillum sp.]
MVTLQSYIKKLRYFILGYEYYAFILLGLAIIIGIIDALGISLLYPMLSEGFQIKANSIPFQNYFSIFSNIIPIGSPFVHLGILFILLTGISLFLQLVYWKIAFHFKKIIVIRIKKQIFKKLETNDYRYFTDIKQGDIINLFNQSPIYVEQTYDRIISLCADFFATFLVIIMLFVISPIGLGLVVFGGIIFFIIMHIIGTNVSEKMGLLQIASGQSENKVINEFIIGIKAITTHNATEYWRCAYNSALDTYWNKYASYNFIQRVPIIALNSLFYASIGVVILLTYIYYSDNFITIIPVLGTFAGGTMKILPKVMNMGDYKLQLNSFMPHLNIIYQSLHETKYNQITNGVTKFPGLESNIQFNDVTFKYNQNLVLKDVSFLIKKGCVTALVGSSGSGKSTIVSLLLRLYDPTNGTVLINGEDLKNYDQFSYRDNIGYVSQEPFVFHETIRENIIFGGDYSDLEVFAAAKQAHAHNFIVTLPDGYDTIIGDFGLTLSGGEKQRIVIARAMIRRPEILIFDEATSSLDNESELIVQKAIDEIAKECTTLVIAHRLTTIQKADMIYVLEKGQIIENGTHEELLRRNGRYMDLWRSTE